MLVDRLLRSKHFGVPKLIRKLVLAPLKGKPSKYTRANRVLSGYERRLAYSVNDTSQEIRHLSKAATDPCFIDCGFNEGVVLAKFADALPGFSIIGYEVQRELFNMVSAKMPHCRLVNAAVSNRIGTADLFVCKDFTYNVRGGTTIMADVLKKNDLADTETIECVDFREELQEIRKKHDFVAVKMDIEGAEYDVLEHLLSTSERLIDILVVEFHPKMVERSRHDAVVQRIRDINLPMIIWY
jgi:FkbM family methyltransferase